MSENKTFTEEEDKLIKYLYDDLKIKKWAMVAKRMADDYGLERNAKQCRDRYQKFLDPLASAEWTEEEEKRLYDLHSTIGNKWALIASYFPGKTDNYLKNHFYSKLRKALRHLNKIIKTYFRKLFKEIQIGTVYKIIEGFEEQFKEKPHVSKEVSIECCNLKDELIQFANESEEMEDRIEALAFEKEKVLIERIIEFSKNYRKKSKKEKRESLQIEELFKPSKRINLIMENQKEDEDSEFEGVNSIDSSEEENDNEMGSEFPSKLSYEDSMKEERDDIRKSPTIYVIYKEEENDSPSSVKSGGIDIRLSDPKSSNKMEEEEVKNSLLFEVGGSENEKLNFGFMRGESSFRSYASQSGKSLQEKTEMLRYSESPSRDMYLSVKPFENEHEMQNEREESIFRSHR